MTETKEILVEILFDKAERIARDVVEEARKEKQRNLTVDETVDLISDIVFNTAVLLAKLEAPAESLERYLSPVEYY